MPEKIRKKSRTTSQMETGWASPMSITCVNSESNMIRSTSQPSILVLDDLLDRITPGDPWLNMPITACSFVASMDGLAIVFVLGR